jgi:hypothetical protein
VTRARDALQRRGPLDRIGGFASRTGWALLLGLAAGLSIGWLAGSFTACAETKCEANTAAIEAAGTWVGGLGTIAAVLFAVNQFRAEQRHRVEERMRREVEERQAEQAAAAADQAEEDRVRAEADMVVIRARIRTTTGDDVTGIGVLVENQATRTSIYKLKGTVLGYGPIAEAREVLPGHSSDSTDYGRAGSSTEKLPVRLTDEAARRAFIQSLTAVVSITFEMNDRRWRRVGNDPVELLT